jgi:hypothetical protein
MKLNRPYDEIYVLDNLISFDYVQLYQWCLRIDAWVKSVELF